MNFTQYQTHPIPYFISSNKMWISMLYFKLSSILMLDVSNNSAPSNISDMFTPTSQVICCNNYYITDPLQLVILSTKPYKNSFASIMAKIWNSIPENLRKLLKHAFKKKIHNLLFLNLQSQDGYQCWYRHPY